MYTYINSSLVDKDQSRHDDIIDMMWRENDNDQGDNDENEDDKIPVEKDISVEEDYESDFDGEECSLFHYVFIFVCIYLYVDICIYVYE
jgi:hypothetical protein